MTPTSFKETNHVYGKPASMTDEECSQLPVCITQNTKGFPQVISKWKLSPEELEEINRTGCVYLGIVTSTAIPPVWLTPLNPFKK